MMDQRFQPFYILPDTPIGRYVIRKAIGHGGGQMAYLADASDGRRVVVKMSLFPKDREDSGNRTMHERFLRQIALFLQLDGTLGVAGIFAHDMFPDQSESSHAYLVQEWIPGSINILDWHRDKPHKLKKVLAGYITLAHACAEMMHRGICHRDLKPENILVTPDGLPKIVDFDTGRGAGATRLTTRGPDGWPGTKLYYSPEVCKALLTDPTSIYGMPSESLFAGDLHALGVIFYQVLTGKHPFDENAVPEKLFEQIAYEVPKLPSSLNPEVPFGLDKVTMRLLEKDPERRYRFGDEVVAQLTALLNTGEDWERPFQTPGSHTSPPPATGFAEPQPFVIAETASVQPAPRRVPRRRLALLLAATITLALVVAGPFLRQHGIAGWVAEKGTMLAGQVKTTVVAIASMVLSACSGLTGTVRTDGKDWLAKCPADSRKAVDELHIYPDLGMAVVLPGPNAIIPEDGGMEVRAGPVEVSAALPARGGAVFARLFGEIRTGSDGASLHFTKLQLLQHGDDEDHPPTGRAFPICAFASDDADDLIPKVIDPPPTSQLHPGFVFVTTSQLGIHFAQ